MVYKWKRKKEDDIKKPYNYVRVHTMYNFSYKSKREEYRYNR